MRRSTITAFLMTAAAACASAMDDDNLDVLPDPPPGALVVRLETVAAGLIEPLEAINNDGPPGQSFPTDATALPDGSGRVLVMTLGGKIHLIDGAGQVSLFHDLIDPDVSEIRPRNFGPTAIAAHPAFASNGRFYTVETEVESTAPADFGRGSNHQDVLYEYAMDNPAADSLDETAFTKREVLRIDQPQRDHNANDLAFMPDGTMLVAIGDGGNTNGTGSSPPQLDAADISTIHGKILRIDPLGNSADNGAYGVPGNNPLIGVPGALPEIYSYGHRNPFRISVDAQTGQVWVGEVGQRTVEEINRLAPGGNHGWPRKEGSFLFGDEAGDVNDTPGIDNEDVAPDPDADANGTGDFADDNNLVDPIFEYDHGTGDSVAGGLVYRGIGSPALFGLYVFGDTDASEPGGLFYADPADGPVSGRSGGARRFAIDPAGAPLPSAIVGFAADAAGEVLILTTTGEVLHIADARCPADLTGPGGDGVPDGTLTSDDFFFYLGLFADGDLAADLTGPGGDGVPDGNLTSDDFFFYLGLFAQGCP